MLILVLLLILHSYSSSSSWKLCDKFSRLNSLKYFFKLESGLLLIDFEFFVLLLLLLFVCTSLGLLLANTL